MGFVSSPRAVGESLNCTRALEVPTIHQVNFKCYTDDNSDFLQKFVVDHFTALLLQEAYFFTQGSTQKNRLSLALGNYALLIKKRTLV